MNREAPAESEPSSAELSLSVKLVGRGSRIGRLVQHVVNAAEWSVGHYARVHQCGRFPRRTKPLRNAPLNRRIACAFTLN